MMYRKLGRSDITVSAMGLFTDKYKGKRQPADNDARGKQSPDWMKYFVDGKPEPGFLKRIKAVRDILTSNRRSLVQGALAWLWARSSNTIPIPGFRTLRQVEENAEAMETGPLTADQVTEITHLLN